MENLQLRLRNEILSVIFKLANGVWSKVLLIVIAQTLLTYFVITPLLFKFMGVDATLFASMQNTQDLALLQYQMQEMVQSLMGLGFGAIMLIFLVWVISIIITCYVYLLVFRLTEAKLKGKNITFEEIFQDSISPKVLKMAGAYLLIFLMTLVIMFVAIYIIAQLGILEGLLSLIAMFFISAFMIRFILSLAKIAYHDEGSVVSMSYSMKQISFGKGMKYTAIVWLSFIILAIIAFVLSYIFGLIGGSSPTMSLILTQVLNILIGSYFMALGAAVITALFFRAEGVSDEDGFKIEDHLISEE